MPDEKLSPLQQLLAQRLAQQGRNVAANPVTNSVLGAKYGKGKVDGQTAYGLPGLGGKLPNKQDQSSTTRGRPTVRLGSPTVRSKADPVVEQLLSRFRTADETGLAVPGQGMISGMALRPEVRKNLAELGEISMIDIANITPEEQNLLRMMLDPKWVAAQIDPGANLSDEEKQQLQAKALAMAETEQ